MPRCKVALMSRLSYRLAMKLVRFEPQDELEEKPIASESIPEVSSGLYGELFFAAGWSVRNRPWETAADGALFALEDSSTHEKWQAFLAQDASGLCLFSLVRDSSSAVIGRHDHLEVQFISSDFLQGHDYELNVRYAPDVWDECERDVIVLRVQEGTGSVEHPLPGHVELLTKGLLQLQAHCEVS